MAFNKLTWTTLETDVQFPPPMYQLSVPAVVSACDYSIAYISFD